MLSPQAEEPPMSELVTVGIDLAKSIFQIHGVDESGRVLVPSPTPSKPAARVLREAAALSHRHGGLRRRSRLGAQASGYGA